MDDNKNIDWKPVAKRASWLAIIVSSGIAVYKAISRKTRKDAMKSAAQTSRTENFSHLPTNSSVEIQSIPDDGSEGWVEMKNTSSVSNEDLKSFFSACGNLMATVGMEGQALKGLLECNIPIGDLLKAKNNPGYLRGYVIGPDGKYSEQALLKPADLSRLYPAIAIQATSMVTGMYYMNEINEKLRAIDNKLSRLEAHQMAEDKTKLAKISAALVRIYPTWKKGRFDNHDRTYLREKCDELEGEIAKFKDLLAKVKNPQLGNYTLIDKQEVTKTISSWDSEQYFQYLELLFYSEQLKYFTNVMAAQMEYIAGESDRSEEHIRKLSVDLWGNGKLQFDNFKSIFSAYFKEVENSALLYSDTIKKEKDELMKKFDNVERIAENYKKNVSVKMMRIYEGEDKKIHILIPNANYQLAEQLS